MRTQFVIDGVRAEVVVADAVRQDLKSAGIGDGAHGVRFSVPHHFLDDATHQVCLHVADADGNMIEVDRREVAFERQAVTLKGRVEGFRNGRCIGWVWDSARGGVRLPVRALWRGEVVADDVADKFRKDLQAAAVGDGVHGFEISLPARIWKAATLDDLLRIETAEGIEIGAIRLPSTGLAQELLDRGRRAERDRDLASAKQNYDEALKLSPDHVDALCLRARIAADEKDTETARGLALRAMELHPGHPRAVVVLGRISYDEGDHLQAITFWPQVRPGNSAYRESLIKFGRSLQRLGRHVEVLKPGRDALGLNLNDLDAHRLLADAYLALGSVALAEPHLRRLVAAQPGDRKIQMQLQRATLPALSRNRPWQSDLEIFENPTLQGWRGPAAGTVSEPIFVASGVCLRPSRDCDSVVYRVCEPEEFRAGDLPHFGLRVSADGGPAELACRLRKDVSALLRTGVFYTFEARLLSGVETAIGVALHVEAAAQPSRRVIESCIVSSRKTLFPLDLTFDDCEIAALESGNAWIVMTVPAGTAVALRVPRPRMARAESPSGIAGFEGPSLAQFEVLP